MCEHLKEKEYCGVYYLDKNGYYLTKTAFPIDEFDEKVMIKFSECEHPKQLKPKWDFENKKWIEAATEEELLRRFEQQKLSFIESNKFEVSNLCLSIASQLEQSNWINFPEDYNPEEIEEKKNQIREIRTKGKEIREQIASCQSLDEILQIDMRMIREPEIEDIDINNAAINVNLE